MTEFADIRAGIKVNLDPLNADDQWIEVSEYALPDPGLRLPVVMVWGIDETDYSVAFQQGGQEVTIRVRALVGTMTEVPPQVTLDRLLMGQESVKELLETDRTLGSTVEDSYVSSMTGHTEFPLGASRVLGADWVLRTILAGT